MRDMGSMGLAEPNLDFETRLHYWMKVQSKGGLAA